MSREAGTIQTATMLTAVHDALRAADPSAFTVLPRVLRRVLRHELDLPGLMTRIPHRETYIVTAEHLRQVVSPDELSHDPGGTLPSRVILLARPEEDELPLLSSEALLQRYWRLLFHARMHAALEERVEKGLLTAPLIRQRIDRIGQVAFDEIDAVLRNETMLTDPGNRQRTFTEFVAFYWELRLFRPEVLPTYFPSLRDLNRIDAILKQDIDAPLVFQATRLAGAPLPAVDGVGTTRTTSDLPPAVVHPLNDTAAGRTMTEKTRQLMLRQAERASQRGNQVRSAIIQYQAARGAWPETAEALQQSVATEIDRLASRLQEALGLDPKHAEAWRQGLAALLPHSAVGFWNSNARLLYDLQKVCLSYERETYVVDLLTWAFTLGRRPLRRPLPNQRAVLMSRYLRTAAGRLKNAELSPENRENLANLLREAMEAAETRLRDRLRPVISTALRDVDLQAENVPEEIAVRKIVEELLDAIVQRGFLTMGDLRDAVSRSHLKLSDLSGPSEMWQGDPLLRADKELSIAIDGVYQRAPFYLRWLQRLSSLAFGTRPGRWTVLNLILPFGGAYVLLVAGEHLVHVVQGHKAETPTELPPFDWQAAAWKTALVIGLGTILYGLMHAPRFREFVIRALRATGRGLRRVFVDFPRTLYQLAFVRAILRSAPVVIFRRHLMSPLLLTLLFCWALPTLRLYERPSGAVTAFVWMVLTIVLNSRAGRDIEEVAAERIERAWHRIRIHFFVALFDLIMDTFKRILEFVERVLYSVDEWLRFKSGESSLVFGAKAALGIVWTAATFVIRFCVTLLIEPQVNPIKHFPVVTVSHKLILPFSIPLTRLFEPIMGTAMAGTVAGTIVLLLPGVFGFLVWELRGNWRLYEANRQKKLKPVIIGQHGETMSRLLKPGLHSGTVPKLYGKLRRASRQADPEKRRQAEARVHEKLHHVEEALARFFEREFFPILGASRAWDGIPIAHGSIEIGTNSVRVELRGTDGSKPAWLTFAEQSGWVVAGSIEPGWIRDLPANAREVFRNAILGLYQMAGVDLVREQIEECFAPRVPPYDVAERGIVVWPGDRYAVEALYSLEDRMPLIAPKPDAVAEGFQLPVLPGERLIFGMSSVDWDDWVTVWNHSRDNAESNGAQLPRVTVMNEAGAAHT